MSIIDLNCDLGESFGNWRMGSDEALFPRITSANIACGFHGGDAVTMLRTIRLAKEHGVAAGAHPGLPDLLGFGRRPMNLSPEDTYAYFVYQVGALRSALATNGITLHHVKPHGAFGIVLQEEERAEAAAEAICDVMDEPMVYCPAESEDDIFPSVLKRYGVRHVPELYPDLSYAPNGTLTLQRVKEFTDPNRASNQVRRYVEEGCVEAHDGTLVSIKAESICIHGDGPNAAEVADSIRRVLDEHGYRVESVWPTTGMTQ